MTSDGAALDSWREAVRGQRNAYDAMRNPPAPPEPARLMATFKVSLAELGAAGEDAPVDLYRALRDAYRRTLGVFSAPGDIADLIAALARSARPPSTEISVKVNGLDRAQCIRVRSILDAAERRASLEDVAHPAVIPLRNLLLAWEDFADVRTNDPRSEAEKRQAQRPERGWITY